MYLETSEARDSLLVDVDAYNGIRIWYDYEKLPQFTMRNDCEYLEKMGEIVIASKDYYDRYFKAKAKAIVEATKNDSEVSEANNTGSDKDDIDDFDELDTDAVMFAEDIKDYSNLG